MNHDVVLRDVVESDLLIFFEHQKDPDAIFMAAFTTKDPTSVSILKVQWKKILDNENISKKTIIKNDQIVGHVLSFEQFDEREVSYWIGREYWGQGIASQALAKFLEHEKNRPLYARAAKDNYALIRVLEKCKFVVIGENKGYANARGKEIKEYILKLDER
jgi:RimJ/RimL family protein N-acetyltransferase